MVISLDGSKLYYTAKVNAHPIGKILIVAILIAVISGLGVLIYHIETADIKSMLLPFCVFTFLVFYLLGRYTLWNLYGREIIQITTKQFSYQFDYGWYKTEMKHIEFIRLSTDYPNKEIPIGKFEFTLDNGLEDEHSEEWGFVNHSTFNHETTVELPKTELARLDAHLSLLFKMEPGRANDFLPYTTL